MKNFFFFYFFDSFGFLRLSVLNGSDKLLVHIFNFCFVKKNNFFLDSFFFFFENFQIFKTKLFPYIFTCLKEKISARCHQKSLNSAVKKKNEKKKLFLFYFFEMFGSLRSCMLNYLGKLLVHIFDFCFVKKNNFFLDSFFFFFVNFQIFTNKLLKVFDKKICDPIRTKIESPKFI